MAWQYWHRRRWQAIGLFVASLVVTLAGGGLWKHVALFGGEPTVEQEPWARDARVRLLPAAAAATGLPPSAGTDATVSSGKVVGAPIELEGLPAGFVATPVLREATLTFGDDRVLNSPHAPGRIGATQATVEDARHPHWSALMEVDEQTLREDGDRPATYTATIDFVIDRYKELATLPLVEGATTTDGVGSITVSHVQRTPDACEVRYAATDVNLVTISRTVPSLLVVFRLRDGRELPDAGTVARQFILRQGLPPQYNAVSPSIWHPFTFDMHEAYPLLREPRRPLCDEMTMVVSRVSYAGRLTRTLTVENFRLNDHLAGR